ncbi:MAG: hypothetical protein NTY64_06550 [Deltaproteobacteria bacterium]|nr:hypothetical protein [Deltaproteobacteria bacterium]
MDCYGAAANAHGGRLERRDIGYNFDGFVKSPSAALRFTFVAAAYHPSTPQVLRAGSRETRESFLRSHLFGDFLRDHNFKFESLGDPGWDSSVFPLYL